VIRKPIDMWIYNIIFGPCYEYVTNSCEDIFDLRVGNDTVPIRM